MLGNRIKLSTQGYIKAVLAVMLIFAAIVLYVFQFDHFGKLLDGKYFLLLSAGIGLLIGSLIGHQFAKEEFELAEKMRLYVFCAGLTIVFMPLLIGLINRYLDFSPPQQAQVQLLELKTGISQPFGYVKGEKLKPNYRMVILYDQTIYKLTFKEPAFTQHTPGDMITIPIRKGLLGIRYFDF